MKHNVSGSSLLHNVNNSSSTLSTPRGVSGSGAPPQQRGRTTVSSSAAASQRSFSASSAAAAHVARTRSGSANRSALGDRSYQQQVVPGTQHGVVKPATWTSTPIREDGRPDVSRSTSCATATQQHVDPLQHSATMIATSAPSASSVAAQHSLLIDELSAVDSFSFGNDAVGSVRLDYVSGNTSTSATAPATATTVGGDIDASNVSASSHRYVSPFGLRDPVTLRIDRTSVTIARTSSSSSSSLSTPSSSPAANVVMTIAFTAMARVELRRDGSLLLRRADHQEVVVSMHSAPKVVAAYKILTVRCRGAFPKNTEDATYTIERHLQAFASAAPVTAADDSATTTTPPLPPAVAALQPAATGGATSSSSSRRIASSSPSLPQRSSSSSSARKSSPQVSSVVSSVLHVDIPPVQLPPPRTIPNRTAKTPIAATLARGASNGAAADHLASADDTDSNVSPRLGAQSSASLSPKPHVRVVHNLSSPSASSTSAIASREERRLQLRAQLLSLRKDRPLPS